MKKSPDVIETGKSVRVEFTATSGGHVVESTAGRPPLYYVHGDGRVLPGFQKKLEGHKEGDELEFELSPEEAYGPFRDEAVIEIPKSEVPQRDLKPGMILQETQPDGTVKVGRVQEIRESGIVMNFNHPMAGKTLHYKIRVVSVMSGASLFSKFPQMKFENESPEGEKDLKGKNDET